MKNINLIIDFDSTFVKEETLDILAKVSLENIQKGLETAYDKNTKSIKVHIMQ